MEFIFGVVLGAIVGFVGAAIRLTPKSDRVGTLNIITSVYEEPYLYLDLDREIKALTNLDQVIFDVNSRHIDSQH